MARLSGRLPNCGAVACALALVLVATLAAPEPAVAFPSLNPADWAVDGFKAILEWIFGDFEDLADSVVSLLLGVPLLADARAFPGVHEYREYVTAGCWGILGLAFVIATIRYFQTGLTGGDAYGAVMGFARVVGAIVMLLMFPRAFDLISRITNEFTHAMIVNPVVGDGLKKGAGPFAAFVALGSLVSSGGFGLIVGLAGFVMVVILIVVKVTVTALLAVLYVLSSLAAALWPIDELSWALRNLIQAMLVLLMFPVIWAICFGVFALLSVDSLFPTAGGGMSGFLAPLLALTALIVAFKLPFVVLRQALNAGLMPSASRRLRDAYLAQRVLPGLGP